MSIKNFVDKEIELAIKNGDEYSIPCYLSAQKAMHSLIEDEHSGASIIFTQGILDRLINYKPLSPITEKDEFIELSNKISGEQCCRCSSLFRYKNGNSWVYTDIDRVTAVDIISGTYYHHKVVDKIVDNLYPIELPYYPLLKKFYVYTETVELENSYMVAYHYLITPDNLKVELDLFCKYITEIKEEPCKYIASDGSVKYNFIKTPYTKEVKISKEEFYSVFNSVKDEKVE